MDQLPNQKGREFKVMSDFKDVRTKTNATKQNLSDIIYINGRYQLDV